MNFYLESQLVLVAGVAHPAIASGRIESYNIAPALEILDDRFNTIISLEKYLSEKVGQVFKQKSPANQSLAIIIEDFQAPSIEQFNLLYKVVMDSSTKGSGSIIHCMGGHGRTGTMLASLALREFLEMKTLENPSLLNYDMTPTENIEVLDGVLSVSPIIFQSINKIREASFEKPIFEGLAVETMEQLQSLVNLEKYLVIKQRKRHSRKSSYLG